MRECARQQKKPTLLEAGIARISMNSLSQGLFATGVEYDNKEKVDHFITLKIDYFQTLKNNLENLFVFLVEK